MKNINTDLNPNETKTELATQEQAQTGEVITNYENIGLELANFMIDSENALFTTRRLTIADSVKKASAHKREFLDGYAKGLSENGVKDNVRDSRKSELKAIFEAITQADSESLALINSCAGWHDYVKACRAFNTSNVAPEIAKARELKKLENKAVKEAKEKAEAEAKANAPLSNDDFPLFIDLCKRLTLEQASHTILALNELVTVRQAEAEAEAKAKEKAEAEAKAKAKAEAQARLAEIKAEAKKLEKLAA